MSGLLFLISVFGTRWEINALAEHFFGTKWEPDALFRLFGTNIKF
jgi:hypothetical protein